MRLAAVTAPAPPFPYPFYTPSHPYSAGRLLCISEKLCGSFLASSSLQLAAVTHCPALSSYLSAEAAIRRKTLRAG